MIKFKVFFIFFLFSIVAIFLLKNNTKYYIQNIVAQEHVTEHVTEHVSILENNKNNNINKKNTDIKNVNDLEENKKQIKPIDIEFELSYTPSDYMSLLNDIHYDYYRFHERLNELNSFLNELTVIGFLFEYDLELLYNDFENGNPINLSILDIYGNQISFEEGDCLKRDKYEFEDRYLYNIICKNDYYFNSFQVIKVKNEESIYYAKGYFIDLELNKTYNDDGGDYSKKNFITNYYIKDNKEGFLYK